MFVYTGDQAGAGTDANVEIILVGESGDTGPVKLDRKGKNDFERGRLVNSCHVFGETKFDNRLLGIYRKTVHFFEKEIWKS